MNCNLLNYTSLESQTKKRVQGNGFDAVLKAEVICRATDTICRLICYYTVGFVRDIHILYHALRCKLHSHGEKSNVRIVDFESSHILVDADRTFAFGHFGAVQNNTRRFQPFKRKLIVFGARFAVDNRILKFGVFLYKLRVYHTFK